MAKSIPDHPRFRSQGFYKPRRLMVQVQEVPKALNSLPRSAWPYELVVAVQSAGPVASVSGSVVRIQAVEMSLTKLLESIGITVDPWP